MVNLMYFGVPGAVAEVRCPESGMGFVDNLDNEGNELVSGGRSIYRAPTTYRTYSMSWSANSQKLRHLIDCYNGQYGNGPFYVTDPTQDDANVLPARWSNAWQLAHQANGWCSPVVQEWPAAITPSLTDYKTPYRLLLTQAPVGSSVPVEGILRTRTIRVPGKAYYFAAKGTATGGAGIRIRGYNANLNQWTLLTTFTTLTGALSNVISDTNTTYSFIELDVYMPLGSTLTLYGMSLGTQNYAIPGELLNTNWSPNPRGGAGITSNWNTAAGTGGAAEVVAYDYLYPQRKNYGQNPQGTSATKFATYTPGAGETGATTYLTGQSDGPIPEITNYARWTTTAAKTSGSTGWIGTASGQRNPLAGVTGESATISIWLRYTGAGTLMGRMRSLTYLAGSQVTSTDSPAGNVTLPSGVWTRVDCTVTSTGAFDAVGFWFYHTSAYIPAVGSTLDITGMLIEKNVNGVGNYFDGSFPAIAPYNYIWESTVNNSISQERVPSMGPDNRRSFIQYRQITAATGETVGPFMRDVTGNNAGNTGDVRYAYAYVRVNQSRQVRMSCSFKNGTSFNVGPITETPLVTMSPGLWYKFESGPMVATGPFVRFQQWISTVASAGVPLPPEFTFDVISWITTKPSDEYWDGDTMNTDSVYNIWAGTPGMSMSYKTDHAPYSFMPSGTGVGAVQFGTNLTGNLVSAVIDRIGLSLDLTEVQNVESRMM